MIRANLINENGMVGYFQVDPFDYEYNGRDPGGHIEDHLQDIADGNVRFDRSPALLADDDEENRLNPEERLVVIGSTLNQFDQIGVHYLHDFE